VPANSKGAHVGWWWSDQIQHHPIDDSNARLLRDYLLEMESFWRY
jgi:hypothetical protein